MTIHVCKPALLLFYVYAFLLFAKYVQLQPRSFITISRMKLLTADLRSIKKSAAVQELQATT